MASTAYKGRKTNIMNFLGRRIHFWFFHSTFCTFNSLFTSKSRIPICKFTEMSKGLIIRSFSFASLSVKLALFKAYCTPIYGCQLWSRLFQYSNIKLQVAYNDAFRQLLREPRWCSASRLFVYNNVPSFDAVIRKLVYTFWCSLCKSDNMLIQAVLSSDIYFQSSLFQRWRSILF